MPLSQISPLLLPPTIDIEFREVPVSNLITGSLGEYVDVVVLVGVRLLLLQILLSLFGVDVEAELVIIVVADPGLGLYLTVDLLDELLGLS